MSGQLYNFSKVSNSVALTEEIQASNITVALADIVSGENTTDVIFKAPLSAEEITTLNTVITNHRPIKSDKNMVLKTKTMHPITGEDNIPYVYNTSKPLGHYVCFQGSGDDLTNPNIQEGLGSGEPIIFDIKSSDDKVVKDFQFNEDVFLKDGYIITKDAPFGSSIDIQVVHPLAGHLLWFGRNIPILGSQRFPLDTEDRASLPAGLIVRITVRNASSNGYSNDNFKVIGRFELFRKKPDTP